ncbi:MAG: type I restriction endonuclease [Acidobacteria bacterium]|nr:type I restriction endonuclease [Acidobacteriota bacterium]
MKAVTQVPAASLAEANRKIYTSLTYGIALEQDRGDGRKSHTVRFLDFDHPERNEWIVTRQYRVLGSKKHVIPDVVVFVNALPLAVIECKSPTIGDAWKAEAVKQLRRYQQADTTWKDQGAPKLFEAAQILVGICGERAVYGTVGTPARFFLEWKQPYPLSVKQFGEQLGRKPTPQDILLYGLLEPRNVLDIVRNFVVFEVEGGRTVRKLTRYKQFGGASAPATAWSGSCPTPAVQDKATVPIFYESCRGCSPVMRRR